MSKSYRQHGDKRTWMPYPQMPKRTKVIDEVDVIYSSIPVNQAFPRGLSDIIENTMTALVLAGSTPDEAEKAMKEKFPDLIG